MELELLEEFDDPRLGYHELIKNGLNTVRKQHTLPERVKNYIESVTTNTKETSEGTSTMSGTDNENQSIINDKNIILYN